METMQRFGDFMREQMRAKGVTPQGLAQETEITPAYIKALLEGDADNLPPAPYVRGYIKKIAQVLEIDADTFWEEYEKGSSMQRSGDKDILPTNRYATRTTNTKGLLITIAVLVVFAWAAPQVANFFGKPSLTLTSPTQETIVVTERSYVLQGTIKRADDKILINAEEISVQEDGSFSKEVSLQEGRNVYQIVAKRFLGRQTSITRTIVYQKTNAIPQSSDLLQDIESLPSPIENSLQ